MAGLSMAIHISDPARVFKMRQEAGMTSDPSPTGLRNARAG